CRTPPRSSPRSCRSSTRTGRPSTPMEPNLRCFSSFATGWATRRCAGRWPTRSPGGGLPHPAGRGGAASDHVDEDQKRRFGGGTRTQRLSLRRCSGDGNLMRVIENSVPAVLRERAGLQADDTAFTFIDYERDLNGVAESLTWSQLYRRVLSVARELEHC